MNFTVEKRPQAQNPHCKVILLKGQLETTTVVRFEDAVKIELQSPPFRWIFSVGELDYISSAGLSGLVGLKHKLDAKQGKLCFAGMSDKVKKVFNLLGLLPMFEFYGDEAAALKAMQK